MVLSDELHMKMPNWTFTVCLILIHPSTSQAWDEHDQKALDQTQRVLTNPEERSKALQTNPDGQKADARVRELGGDSATSEAIYKLASETMAKISKEANGEPKNLEQIMQKLIQNPESFGQYLSPEQRAELKRIAEKVESRQPAQRP